MPLINCPECKRMISSLAKACPHCGLPEKYFSTAGETDSVELRQQLDFTALRNTLIAFDHSYQTIFSKSHYITARDLDKLRSLFGRWAEMLNDKTIYSYCKENASRFAIDFGNSRPLCHLFQTRIKPLYSSLKQAEYRGFLPGLGKLALAAHLIFSAVRGFKSL